MKEDEAPPALESPAAPAGILAVDPGRAKCGLAIVDASGAVLYRGIVPSTTVASAVQDLSGQFAVTHLVLGNGTGAATIYASILESTVFLPVARVDEKYTSQQARALYLKENPARGLRRLIPKALRAPEGAYDDYAAVLLARRYLAVIEAGPDAAA